MTAGGPANEHPTTPAGAIPPPVSPAIERANRMNAANMLRSLLPLVVICLLLVGWQAFRSSGDVGVRTVDPSSSVQLAAARAGYALEAPTDLDEGYRPTSVRTDAGAAEEGDPVTLEIGYLTPEQEFVGFVISDDQEADPVTDVLDGAQERGTVDVGGQRWTRSTTADGETALSRDTGGATVLVTGSASEAELETVAASVRPHAP